VLHGHEPIEFHDPIITTRLHIIWNMSWVHKHVTQPSIMWFIPCSIVMNDILLNNVCACENHHNLVFTHVPSQCPLTCATRYWWMRISSHKWCWEGIGFVRPKLHHLRVNWHTWVSGIRVAFFTLCVIVASTTLFLMKPLLFISNVCM
jgi:hypothetical protein